MSNNFVKRDTCPCCNSHSYTIVLALPFNDRRIWPFLNTYYEERVAAETLKSEKYSIAQCNDCELLFQEYIFNDTNMFSLYEEWISAEQSLNKKLDSDIKLFRNYGREIQRICQFIPKKPNDIKVLEYGMGWGFWSNLAKAYNFNVTGVELSKTRVEFASKNNLHIVDDIAGIPSESYDYIYSNQVFEHIESPLQTLTELKRILKKGGIIHIQVPNGKGMLEKLRSPNWQAQQDALHPLEHINCFNTKSLIALAEKTDLKLSPQGLLAKLPIINTLLAKMLLQRKPTQIFLKKTT